MKVLHILRSEPDETVTEMMKTMANGEYAKSVPLYTGDVDWSGLVDDIMHYDKVICWW